MNVITRKASHPLVGVYRYVEQASKQFDDACFDTQQLKERDLLDGRANAGRGNTVFFTLQDDQLVLRRYRRGGFAQRVSKTAYLFLGMNRTRAFCEFDMLLHLQHVGLSAPRPYACRVIRKGLLYTASLVTYRLFGDTLAERMQADGRLTGNSVENNALWGNIGTTIALFHAAGVYHADLNAHNIMLLEDGSVALIDFDRGKLRDLPSTPVQSGWCLDNLDRLERSIRKVATSAANNNAVINSYADGFKKCKQNWAAAMVKSH